MRWKTLALCALASSALGVVAQTPLPSEKPLAWVEAAAANEEKIVNDDGTFPLRYLIRKVDAKNDVTRDVIESRQGTVARLVKRNGQLITPEEDAAERERLQEMLSSPKDFIKHHKRDNASRGYSIELIRAMPKAMLFAYTPGQPQRAGLPGPQVVLDFVPDPHYVPPTLVTRALTGLSGRIWIDRKTLHVVRIEGQILHAIDFGWGVLAKIFPGGTIEFEQANAGGERWAYAHLRSSLTIREMMVKTVHQATAMDAADFRLLATPVDYQEAVHMLLNTPVVLQQTHADAGR